MSVTDSPSKEIEHIRGTAECLFDREAVDAAIARMAADITAVLAQENPLVLAIMSGGMVPAAMLLRELAFPLEMDYIHLTRYGANTTGSELEWIRRSTRSVKGRTVLLVDDLLDHGLTLAAAIEDCRAAGAAKVLTAVLVIKTIEHRAGLSRTDFHALETPDRYLFGSGMDYKHYWRNAPGIFAVAE